MYPTSSPFKPPPDLFRSDRCWITWFYMHSQSWKHWWLLVDATPHLYLAKPRTILLKQNKISLIISYAFQIFSPKKNIWFMRAQAGSLKVVGEGCMVVDNPIYLQKLTPYSPQPPTVFPRVLAGIISSSPLLCFAAGINKLLSKRHFFFFLHYHRQDQKNTIATIIDNLLFLKIIIVNAIILMILKMMIMLTMMMMMTTWPHFPSFLYVRHFFSEASLAPNASFHKKSPSSSSLKALWRG